ISPLELFSLAFVVSTAATYYFWLRKPQNVGTTTLLECQYSVAEILKDAGLPEDMPYQQTPLEFIDKQLRPWERRSVFKDYDLEKQANNPRNIAAIPTQRIPDDFILPPLLPIKIAIPLILSSLVHSTIHLLGWNFEYPTHYEQTLWRVAA